MKIKASILLIQSYSTFHVKVDKNINLKDLTELAEIDGHVLFAPKVFLLKEERPLEGNEDGFFFAISLPRKKGVSAPDVERTGSQVFEEDFDGERCSRRHSYKIHERRRKTWL